MLRYLLQNAGHRKLQDLPKRLASLPDLLDDTLEMLTIEESPPRFHIYFALAIFPILAHRR